MKLVTFVRPGADPAGLPGLMLPGAGIIDLGRRLRRLPRPLGPRHREAQRGALPRGPRPVDRGGARSRAAASSARTRSALLAPLPRPVSVRDGYAFRQHVETARRNRGLAMIPEFDEFPVFYFTNALAVIGPGRAARRPAPPREARLRAGVLRRHREDGHEPDARGGRRRHPRLRRHERPLGPRPPDGGDEAEPRPGQGEGLRDRDRPLARHEGRARRTGSRPRRGETSSTPG